MRNNRKRNSNRSFKKSIAKCQKDLQYFLLFINIHIIIRLRDLGRSQADRNENISANHTLYRYKNLALKIS